MRIEMAEFVEDGITAPDAEAAQMLANLKDVPGCVRSFVENRTDRGDFVSAYAVVILRPGAQYDLPAEAARKLIDIGYAIAAPD